MRLRNGLDIALRRWETLLAPDAATSHIVTWRGQKFPCSISTEQRGELVELGGDMVEVQITILIRVSAMEPMLDASSMDVTSDNITLTSDDDAIPPAANHEIELTSLNRTYRIAQVRLNGSGSHYSLQCVDPYRP